jgi:hypothetical protein
MNLTPCLLLLALPTLGLAQKPLEPRDPVLSQAPGRAEWTVRITDQFPDGWATDNSWEAQGDATNKAPTTRAIRSLTYAKDATLQTYQVTTRWTDGETEQEWIVMGQHIADRPGGGLYVVGAERLTASELKVSDFPELVWLERKHFTGVRTFKGKQVFVFEEQFNRRRMTPTESRQYLFALQADPKATPEQIFKPRFPKVVAYLDAVTQLPVLYNDGSKLRIYSFQDPGGSRLRPPQQIIDFVRQRQAALDARLTPPAGPGKTTATGQ